MASSSSSLPLSLPLSSPPRNWEHDVFPSFHGPDVRKHFLSHILKEFRSKGIDLFIDNEIKRGESIGPKLKQAIRGSKIAIVLLSKNYASSSWCLDELVEIMNKVVGQTVLTIFYDVDPTDVKKQIGYFGKVFKKTCQGKTKKKTETWRKALEGVATIAGYHSRNWVDEATMIENIAANISKMLNHLAPSPDLDHLIGMGAHMDRMESLLHLDLKDEVRMIGIWGPLGIGKSTIARFVFNQFSNSFQLGAIMVNIKESYPRPCLDVGSAQLKLQNQMLSLMINHKETMITHLGVAKERLKDKKVLMVLDDVDQLAQLDALARESRWFGPGSRIIITTEDRRVLDAHGMINFIYKVDYPTNKEALQIFCMHAFDQKTPKDGFTELSCEITFHAGQLPLGLKVMGSYFRGMSKDEWVRVLPNLRNRLNGEIESILKFSYDALCDDDKDVFLHIACFFNYEFVEKVEEHLANKFLDVRLKVLAEKSLISIDDQGRIEMHSLLVRLGKEIVRKQSNHEPGKRQFLVDDKDIGEVLTDPAAISRSVIGIYAKHTTLSWDNLNISERAFERMSNLQFLKVSDRLFSIYGRERELEWKDFEYPNIDSLLGGLKYISPKLQLLDWEFSPMTCLPFTFNLEFLVELNMRYSKLEKLWDGIKLLRNLKWMDLSYSENLKELPNLSTATSLQELNLIECSSLVELPSSIGNATNLHHLRLIRCSSLVELPLSIGSATNLQILNLCECSSLVKLPSSIGNATNLQILFLYGCSSLVELSFSVGNATNLQELDLRKCSSLMELPSSIGNATNLQDFNLSCCSSLVELPSSIGNATNLQKLNLSECSSLVKVPSSIGNATNLQMLDLSYCSSLVDLSFSIGNATNLQKLYLYHCSSLAELSPSIGMVTNLECLDLSYCSNLVELPSSIGNLQKLWKLTMVGCSKLEVLPTNINLESLTELNLTSCSLLKSFPEISTNIEVLKLSETGVEEVPSSIRSWSNLRGLHMSYCENLQVSPHALENITDLYLDDEEILAINPWVKGFSRLGRLILNGMQNLRSLPQFPDSLWFLDAENCESLEILDCSFRNPKIGLRFVNCFNLNQEARDIIIQTSTSNVSILPGGEVPACFTYRALFGSRVTVKLNEKPRHTSTKIKACILLVGESEPHDEEFLDVECSITYKENGRSACRSYETYITPVLSDHLYIFDFEAKIDFEAAEVTSTELIFEFKLQTYSYSFDIRECGILQPL